jgi:glucitol/sorbitol PTS system EIIA component
MAELIYALEITSIGPLVEEFTAEGVWVFFHEGAPEELAEFAILHRAPAPLRPLIPGQRMEIGEQSFHIAAVGEVANQNLANLGHLVLKANGLAEAELPGDVCIDHRPLPAPSVGMWVRVWEDESR